MFSFIHLLCSVCICLQDKLMCDNKDLSKLENVFDRIKPLGFATYDFVNVYFGARTIKCSSIADGSYYDFGNLTCIDTARILTGTKCSKILVKMQIKMYVNVYILLNYSFRLAANLDSVTVLQAKSLLRYHLH